jgi:hypothetical protein
MTSDYVDGEREPLSLPQSRLVRSPRIFVVLKSIMVSAPVSTYGKPGSFSANFVRFISLIDVPIPSLYTLKCYGIPFQLISYE